MLRPVAERAALLARISKQYNIGNLSALLHFLDVERFWGNNSYTQNYNATNLTMPPMVPHADTTVDACEPLLDVLDFFHLYYIPCIICMGILGNVLSCIVFLSTHLKMRSSSYYLAALATADLSFLVSLFMVWLSNNVGVQLFNKNGWCQFVVYVSSVSSFLSVWLIVAFTVERFIAVQYPLHRPHMCTVARAKMIITFLTIFALLLHLYSFVTAGVTSAYGVDTCDMLHEYHETMRVINIIDSIFTLIVPLFLIVIMNTMITRNLFRFSRHFKSDTSAFEDSGEHVSNSIPLVSPN
ncbi:hypothetical protein B566_EDAN013177 [Ephemera danica]|nr:hypothetical protein B566_EDAN013177 [Ephemera danica]